MFYRPRTCLISYWCETCAYEHHASLTWVLYTNVDIYIYICFDFHVTYVSAPLISLDVLVSLINWLGPPPRAPASCSLDPVLPRYPVPRPWSCLSICICIYNVGSHHFMCPSPTHWMCSHHTSDGGFSYVWLPICFPHDCGSTEEGQFAGSTYGLGLQCEEYMFYICFKGIPVLPDIHVLYLFQMNTCFTRYICFTHASKWTHVLSGIHVLHWF